MYTLIYLKWIANKVVQHRELYSMLCGSLDERGLWRRMDTCILVTESLCCPPETYIVNQLYSNTKLKVLKKGGGLKKWPTLKRFF